jgi:hypothetical protein
MAIALFFLLGGLGSLELAALAVVLELEERRTLHSRAVVGLLGGSVAYLMCVCIDFGRWLA